MDRDDFLIDQQEKFDDEFEEEIYDEDKYDALNEETFGNDMSDGDWETGHEKYVKFDEVAKNRWPHEREPPEPNVFTQPLKTLPELERELQMQINTYNHHYEIPGPSPFQQHFQYQHNFNFVNQHCAPVRPTLESILPLQNVFNAPPGFRDIHGRLEDNLTKPPQKLFSPAISVTDLERQMIDAVKVRPTYSNPVEEVTQGFLALYPYYKQNAPPQYSLQLQTPVHTPKNFSRNNFQRNLNNYKKMNNFVGYQNYNKLKNFTEERTNYQDHGAGFMTLREKHWLAGIQTIQFHHNNPLEEDYYFTMYQKRHYGNSGMKTNNNAGHQKTDQQSKFNNSYTQLQFENSLGKVLIGNVITPRKMIDIETNNLNFVPPPPTINRAVIAQKNSRQILLEIEHMYIPLLKIEHTYYAIRNKSQAMPTVQIYIDELTDILNSHLNNLVSYVTVRKGKQLVHRILPHLKNPSFLWSEFFGPSICAIISKDSEDQLLLLFLPYIRQWIFCLCLAELNQIAEYLMKNLSCVVISVFGISLIANMIERAEEVRPTTENRVVMQWSLFIRNVILIEPDTEEVQRPVIGLDKKIIEKHLIHLPFDQSVNVEKKTNFIQRLCFLVDTKSND
ncbi:Hypothetical protein CINCED_3A023024 [Cinara cedri]|uniref:mRNA decay factor PAT1 domain-containing protein n=1 Tax=Cinara cedri TaxID=506608 RepID=A0A5E4M4A0_9HEMI|nr:Hypothetical protein CINCED_3A023024 [Cinara cedri]